MDTKEENYDFPVNGPSPFEDNFEGHYFVYANKFSNLGKTLSEFSFEAFKEYIPMGYKTIIVNHRKLLLENGDLIIEWEVPVEGIVEGHQDHYILYSEKEHTTFVADWNRFVVSNILRNSKTSSADLKSSVWIDLQECLNYGMEFSRVNNCKVLLSKVIRSISWH